MPGERSTGTPPGTVCDDACKDDLCELGMQNGQDDCLLSRFKLFIGFPLRIGKDGRTEYNALCYTLRYTLCYTLRYSIALAYMAL